MDRIKMVTPLVEMDGDEMTRIMWGMIKDTLILPYVDLKTEYYDLSLTNRNTTDDSITIEAAQAAKRLGVAVKCATITPDKKRMGEYPDLKKMWKSPNGTIRSVLGGTVFRTPIVVNCVKPAVRTWEKPVTIARHAYGDVYKAVDMHTDVPGECSLVFTPDEGDKQILSVQRVEGPAVFLGQHNTDDSIRSFAKACFAYAISVRQDLWFCAKDTISKVYDGRFREIFEEEYLNAKPEMEKLGISYFYTLIDDAVSRLMRSKGGFVWACKNYDGDVMSDLVSSSFGSLAMMSSVLVSPDGNYEFEAAHGTVTKHYYRRLNGEKTPTNPTATIFAWAGALSKRGEKDSLENLQSFGDKLKKACIDTIESGIMTKDLALVADADSVRETVCTEEFLSAVKDRLYLCDRR